MPSKKLCLSACLMIIFSALSFAGSEDFSVSGTVTFTKRCDITVEIINREEYDKNITSKYIVVIPIDDELFKKKKASFIITNVPAGVYMVKVYQDLNKNKQFDFGLIGGEPIGSYKKPGFSLGRPSFASLSFRLEADLGGIIIEL